MGNPRVGTIGALLLCVVGLIYLVMPFSIRLAPQDPPKNAPVRNQGAQPVTRASCIGPWRQVVAPPTLRTRLGDTSQKAVLTDEQNLQPLCRNTGRSRAIAAGWILLAAALVYAVSRPRGRVRLVIAPATTTTDTPID